MWFQRHKDPVSERDLSDFADGQLSPARARRVAAHLRAHPSDADRIHDYWRQEAELYRVFEPVLHESGTPALPNTEVRRPARALSLAAMLGALMLTAGLVWDRLEGEAGTSPTEFTASVIEAYTERLDTGEPRAESAPSLADLDLRPVGARTVWLEGREVVEYRYENENGANVALYEMEAGVEEAGLFQIFEREDTRLVEWTMADKRYALVGEDSASKLTHLAVQIRGNLMTGPSGVEKGLARELNAELDVNNSGGDPVMVQSPGTGRLQTEPLMIQQPANDANTGSRVDRVNNLNGELGVERVQGAGSEM